MSEKKICPACQKAVDPKAPLCQCGDSLIPPVRRTGLLVKVALAVAAVAAILLICSSFFSD